MLIFLLSLLGHILRFLISAYILILIIRMILDWVAILGNWRPSGAMAEFVNIIYSLTEPPLRFLRQYIKPLPLGGISLDIAFIVLYFILIVAERVVAILF